MKPVLFYKEPEKERVINEVIPYLHDDLPDSASKVLSAFRNDRVKIPIVYVGLTTSSEVGGARKTIEAIVKYLDEHKLKDKVYFHGGHCFGKCAEGPVISINGKFYEKVDEFNVIDALNQELGQLILY